MRLLPTACAVMLHATSPCAVPADGVSDAGPLRTVAVTERALATVRGAVDQVVGLDRQGAARDAQGVPVAGPMPRPSDATREIVDNWTLDVAVPLIAAAMSNGR